MATIDTPEPSYEVSGMTLIMLFNADRKLVSCELVNNADDIITNGEMLDDEGTYRFVVVEGTAADNAFINACLNDPDHITLDANGIVRYGDNPSEDVHCRAISMQDWKVRVRPALMRATTTKDAFNL